MTTRETPIRVIDPTLAELHAECAQLVSKIHAYANGGTTEAAPAVTTWKQAAVILLKHALNEFNKHGPNHHRVYNADQMRAAAIEVFLDGARCKLHLVEGKKPIRPLMVLDVGSFTFRPLNEGSRP